MTETDAVVRVRDLRMNYGRTSPATTRAGIALSALPCSGKSATAVVIPIVLLQFISGVYHGRLVRGRLVLCALTFRWIRKDT